MLDADLRELERALRGAPNDRALAQRFLQALRRAGHVGEDAPPDRIEAEKNPGFAPGDLALVCRRSRPRPHFAWLREMDALVGEVAPVTRISRDGLSARLEGESLRPLRDPVLGRSLGFASLYRITS